MKENNLHGSGLRLVNTKEGVHLMIKRNTSGSGNAKCNIFILSDAQINIVNKELECDLLRRINDCSKGNGTAAGVSE